MLRKTMQLKEIKKFYPDDEELDAIALVLFFCRILNIPENIKDIHKIDDLKKYMKNKYFQYFKVEMLAKMPERYILEALKLYPQLEKRRSYGSYTFTPKLDRLERESKVRWLEAVEEYENGLSNPLLFLRHAKYRRLLLRHQEFLKMPSNLEVARKNGGYTLDNVQYARHFNMVLLYWLISSVKLSKEKLDIDFFESNLIFIDGNWLQGQVPADIIWLNGNFVSGSISTEANYFSIIPLYN